MKLNALTSESFIVLLLLIAGGLIVFYTYVYYQEGRQARRLTGRQLWTLRGLRIVAALLALLALARPAIDFTEVQERLPVLPMLVDESLSMSFPEARENPLLADSPLDRRTRYESAKTAVSRLQQPLTRTHRVRLYMFSDSLRLLKELPHRSKDSIQPVKRDEPFFQAPAPTGDYSNIADAMADALRELAGEKVSALVLFSDGRQTGGSSLDALAEQAQAAKVPIHTVVLGSEFPLRDLRIDEVIVGTEASLGDVLTFNVKVTNQIQDSLPVKMLLTEQGKQAATRTVTLKRGQQVVPIAMIPETEGDREFKIVLPEQPDEVNTKNNVAVVHVKIVKRTLKVLLIAGEPSREYFYLVPALLRDPVIDLSCWLQSSDIDYVQQGNTNIDQLPQTLKDWTQYDVAILHDINPNGITTQQVAGLENMVQKGGGLMIISGRSQGLAKLIQVHAAKIRGLLPVEVDKNIHPDHDKFFEQAFTVERTREGRNHPVLLMSSDEKQNEQLWATCPKFYWSHPVGSAKPKSIILLQKAATNQDKGGDCLMAIQRFGEGAVLFCALDSMWLWRFPHESYDYDRFWTRSIRYLGEARLLGTQQQVSLSTDRRTYAPGEDVLINLRILDPALQAQLAGQALFVSAISPQKDEYMVQMRPSPDGQPVYVGAYRAKRIGAMKLRCRQAAPDSDTEAKPLFDVSSDFLVQMQSLEDVDTSANLDAMKLLADKTGGKYFDYRKMGDLDSLAREISAEPQVIKRTIRTELWDGKWFLLLFLILVSVEWSLRKWWGLL